MTSKWNRIEDGYEQGEARIYDNGGGFGPSQGSGRWALEIAGRWVANLNTLAEAKARAASELEPSEAAEVSSLGGRMYGDGEYVLEFENVSSTLAPMVATVLSPTGHGYTLGPLHDLRPSVKLAAELIARVRRDEAGKPKLPA